MDRPAPEIERPIFRTHSRGVTMRGRLPTILALSGVLLLPSTVFGQGLDVTAQALADLEAMQSKFTALAGAMETSQYPWRPMEGVRSVSEVYMLIATENYFIPSIWGAEPSEGATTWQTMNAVTDKHAILEHIERSFAYCKESIKGLSDAQLSTKVQFFGSERTVAEALYAMTGDMHEHLGQAIAYARSNHVVPPWSAGEGM